MNTELKDKWITALRSGEYKQCHNMLRYDNQFCCLGVLCNIIDSSKWYNHTYDGNRAYAPYNVLDWNTQSNLIKLNDFEQYNFRQIADYIEGNIQLTVDK